MSSRLVCRSVVPSLSLLCLSVSLFGVAATARAQSDLLARETPEQRLVRARAAAMAARRDLGLAPSAPRSEAAILDTLQAEVDALKLQNRLLRNALARSEAKPPTVIVNVPRTVTPPPTPTVVYRPAVSEEPVSAADLGSYTGLVIDARDLPNFQRSPSPLIFGPGLEVVYPDSKHVPTPDEVQEESVVRYYHTEDEARHGFVGANPLIIRAISAFGPGNDCVRVSARDMALLKALDDRIGFSRTWKVGILLSAEQ